MWHVELVRLSIARFLAGDWTRFGYACVAVGAEEADSATPEMTAGIAAEALRVVDRLPNDDASILEYRSLA